MGKGVGRRGCSAPGAGCNHKHTSPVTALGYRLPRSSVLLSALRVGFITRQRHAQRLGGINPHPRGD